AQPQPRQLDHRLAHTRVAGLADALLALALPTRVRRGREARQRAELAAVVDLAPGEDLGAQEPATLHAHRGQLHELFGLLRRANAPAGPSACVRPPGRS